MKNKTLLPTILIYTEILFITFFVVIPPLFSQTTGENKNIFTLDFSSILIFFVSVFLYFQWKDLILPVLNQNENICRINSRTSRFSNIIINIKWANLCLGLLCIIYALIELLSYFFPQFSTKNNIIFPELKTKTSLFLFISGAFIKILISAFYEEILYRFTIPDFLLLAYNKFYSRKPEKKYFKSIVYILELFGILIFAFSHRYLGWMPVLNAFLAGIVLRIGSIKTNNPLCTTISHGIYNFLLLIFLYAI